MTIGINKPNYHSFWTSIKIIRLFLISSILTVTTHSAYCLMLPHLFSHGYGVTLGAIYTPASPAIDIRNIMGSTWNVGSENFFVEKYIFNLPYPYSNNMMTTLTAKAAQQGLAALYNRNFDKNGFIQIELDELGPNADNKYTVNFYDSKLINFTVGKSATIVTEPEQPALINEKILVTGPILKKVLDNLVNMKGVPEARYVVKRHGQIILMNTKNKSATDG